MKKTDGLSPNQEKLQAILEYKNYKKITRGELFELVMKYHIAKNPSYLIKSMLLKKRLFSFKRGSYFVIPIKSIGKYVGVDELELNEYLLESKEYYIGLFNAYNLHGFTEQIPNMLFVFNTKYSGEKRILNIRIKYLKIKKEKLFGILNEYKYPYSNKERTIMDVLEYPQYISKLAQIIDEIKNSSFDKNKLVAYAIRCNSIKLMKLVGFLTNNKKLYKLLEKKRALSYYTTIRKTGINLLEKKWKLRLI